MDSDDDEQSRRSLIYKLIDSKFFSFLLQATNATPIMASEFIKKWDSYNEFEDDFQYFKEKNNVVFVKRSMDG